MTISDVFFFEGEIIDYSNTSQREIIIPDNFSGIDVTSIGEKAFEGKWLNSVIIPNTVVTIGYRAFANNFLSEVEIPNMVTTMSSFAFASNRLIIVIISNGLTEIEEGIFYSNRLKEVAFPNAIEKIGVRSFQDNKLNNITLPNTLTHIEREAFRGNDISMISLPNSITSIEYGAFEGNELQTVKLPNSLMTLGQGAFKYNQLDKIQLPVSHKGYSYSWNESCSSPNDGVYQGGDSVGLECRYEISEQGVPVYELKLNITSDSAHYVYFQENDETIVLSSVHKNGFLFDQWYDNAKFEGDYVSEVEPSTKHRTLCKICYSTSIYS